MTVGTQAALWHLDGHRPQALARLFELLRIPSISTDPARNADCETAARWLAAELSSVGFDAAGETVELRITARDRTAYAAGILSAAAWLRRTPRPAGIHAFDTVVDDLLARRATAAA